MKRIIVRDYRFLKLPNGNVTHIQAQGSPFLKIKGLKETGTALEVETSEYIFIIEEALDKGIDLVV